jgi:hypothetical protein|tara:strand:- start:784 stop:3534 length:2751 start_codon:yes stop_codon:yes gene_type:complete
MANFWTSNNGDSLGTLAEQVTIAPLQLPLLEAGASVILISGSLPSGLRLNNNTITGTPTEVARETVSTFVLRATYNSQINDRTFKITVQGADEPVWQTPADLLGAGNNGSYYILDSSPVDFQLKVIDTDTAAGQTLEYFIGSNGGNLPPGIQLTIDGRLVGVVDPILAIRNQDSQTQLDDAGIVIVSDNGFDSYFYDTTVYDLSTPNSTPKKLNRFYEFIVSVSDGDTVSERTFRLYVVGDDFFRSDTTMMKVGTGVFSADNTNVRVPIWLTPRNFGYRRANNYVTLVLDIIDPNSIDGVVSYHQTALNDDSTPSILPPGLTLDTITGEIAGRVPYQPAVTKEYKFTIAAQRIAFDVASVQLIEYMYESASPGTAQIKTSKFDTYSDYVIGQEFSVSGNVYIVTSINTSNTNYDVLTLNRALITAFIKGKSINFGDITLRGDELAVSKKTFVVKLLGEVDSTIVWTTPSNLGSFSANYISTLSVRATTSVPNANLIYTTSVGTLPPGLTLSLSGEIIGKVNSFGTVSQPGLTVFDNQQLQLDGNTTTFDRIFKFTIKAQDQFGFSAIEQEFTIELADPDNKQYSNVFLQPMLSQAQRTSFINLVNNTEIFLPEYLYRPNDANFGTQTKIKILAYAGIEAKAIENFVAAAAKNHKRRKLKIGKVKTAVAKAPGTQDVVYEVVYVEVVDPQVSTIKNQKVASQIKIKNNDKVLVNSATYNDINDTYASDFAELTITTRQDGDAIVKWIDLLNINSRSELYNIPVTSLLEIVNRSGYSLNIPFVPGVIESKKYRPVPANVITVDSNAILASGANDTTRYISNMTHMRDAIRDIGETEKNFLPLWMRTSQADTITELGFVTAIPLCYCKPGTAKIIANTIDFYDIDFNQYELDIDRYLIDNSEGVSQEQYVLFANYEFNT